MNNNSYFMWASLRWHLLVAKREHDYPYRSTHGLVQAGRFVKAQPDRNIPNTLQLYWTLTSLNTLGLI